MPGSQGLICPSNSASFSVPSSLVRTSTRRRDASSSNASRFRTTGSSPTLRGRTLTHITTSRELSYIRSEIGWQPILVDERWMVEQPYGGNTNDLGHGCLPSVGQLDFAFMI